MSVITKPEAEAETLCKFIRAVDALKRDPNFDADDAVIVRSWLDGTTPASHVGRTLRAAGYPVSTTRVKEHRLNDCNCTVSI